MFVNFYCPFSTSQLFKTYNTFKESTSNGKQFNELNKHNKCTDNYFNKTIIPRCASNLSKRQ